MCMNYTITKNLSVDNNRGSIVNGKPNGNKNKLTTRKLSDYTL